MVKDESGNGKGSGKGKSIMFPKKDDTQFSHLMKSIKF